MRTSPPSGNRPSRRAKRPVTSAPADDAQPVKPRPDEQVNTARAATEDELAAVARAQQGQYSAESFWRAAGRFTKLR